MVGAGDVTSDEQEREKKRESESKREKLSEGAQERAPVVLAQLDALVHRPVAVAQVRRERVPEVDAEAFLRAVAC